jgi:flagellar motility protein MotE (MotC chaperone)
MKPIVLTSLYALGGTTLFAGAFVGFATISGTPLHNIPVLKSLVPEPAKASAHREVVEHTRAPVHHEDAVEPEHARPDGDILAANVGVLGAFLLPSPFSVDELNELQSGLTASRAEVEKRLGQIQAREVELDEWERALEERKAELDKLRLALDKRELELTMSADEIERDRKAKAERESQGWKDLARFFQDGEADEMALKLAEFDPKDAVHILRALDEERASALVNALPPEKYVAYLEAYRKRE